MYKQFKTNANLEKSGITLDYGLFRLKCARAGGANINWQKTLDALSKPYKRQIDAETLPEAKGQELLRQAFSRSVVLGWEVAVDDKGDPIQNEEDLPEEDADRVWAPGLHSEDGSIVKFSAEAVAQAFKYLPDLFADIRAQTTKSDLYKEDIREAEAGNSKRS